MTSPGYSDYDQYHMQIALAEARAALAAGDYPVGAVLTVDGELWGQARNSLLTDARSTAHAEHKLFYEFSGKLRTEYRFESPSHVCLYTTLEPCLMCLGIAVMHRVSRLVIACPDPNGGTVQLDQASLGSVYRERWPHVQIGLYREESCDLILDFLKSARFHSWELMMQQFQALKAMWSAG